MENTKHTPGTWKRGQMDISLIYSDLGEDTKPIATILARGKMSLEEINANAELIASAPSLLKENEIMKTALKNIAVGSSDPDHLESIATEALKLISSSKS